MGFRQVALVTTVLLVAELAAQGAPPSLYNCIDWECEEWISQGRTMLRYIGKTEKHLSFGKNEQIYIISKPVDKNGPDWVGKIGNKVGLVPKDMIREDKMNKSPTKFKLDLHEVLEVVGLSARGEAEAEAVDDEDEEEETGSNEVDGIEIDDVELDGVKSSKVIAEKELNESPPPSSHETTESSSVSPQLLEETGTPEVTEEKSEFPPEAGESVNAASETDTVTPSEAFEPPLSTESTFQASTEHISSAEQAEHNISLEGSGGSSGADDATNFINQSYFSEEELEEGSLEPLAFSSSSAASAQVESGVNLQPSTDTILQGSSTVLDDYYLSETPKTQPPEEQKASISPEDQITPRIPEAVITTVINEAKSVVFGDSSETVVGTEQHIEATKVQDTAESASNSTPPKEEATQFTQPVEEMTREPTEGSGMAAHGDTADQELENHEDEAPVLMPGKVETVEPHKLVEPENENTSFVKEVDSNDSAAAGIQEEEEDDVELTTPVPLPEDEPQETSFQEDFDSVGSQLGSSQMVSPTQEEMKDKENLFVPVPPSEGAVEVEEVTEAPTQEDDEEDKESLSDTFAAISEQLDKSTDVEETSNNESALDGVTVSVETVSISSSVEQSSPSPVAQDDSSKQPVDQNIPLPLEPIQADDGDNQPSALNEPPAEIQKVVAGELKPEDADGVIDTEENDPEVTETVSPEDTTPSVHIAFSDTNQSAVNEAENESSSVITENENQDAEPDSNRATEELPPSIPLKQLPLEEHVPETETSIPPVASENTSKNKTDEQVQDLLTNENISSSASDESTTAASPSSGQDTEPKEYLPVDDSGLTTPSPLSLNEPQSKPEEIEEQQALESTSQEGQTLDHQSGIPVEEEAGGAVPETSTEKLSELPTAEPQLEPSSSLDASEILPSSPEPTLSQEKPDEDKHHHHHHRHRHHSKHFSRDSWNDSSAQTSSIILVIKHLSSTLLSFLPEALQDTILDVDDALVFTGIIALTLVSICVPYFLIEGFMSVRPLKKKVNELNKSLWKVSAAYETQQEEFEIFKRKAMAHDEFRKRAEQSENDVIILKELEKKQREQISKLRAQLKLQMKEAVDIRALIEKTLKDKKLVEEEVGAYKNAAEKATEQLGKVKDELQNYQKQSKSTSLQLQNSSKSLEVQQTKIHLLEKEVSNLKEQLATECDKRKVTLEEVAGVTDEKRKVERELAEMKKICSGYEQTVDGLTQEVCKLESELATIKDSLGEDSPLLEIAEVQAKAEFNEKEASSLRTRLEGMCADNETLREKLKDTQQTLDEMKGEKEGTRKRLEVLEGYFKEREEELLRTIETLQQKEVVRDKGKDDLIEMIEEKEETVKKLEELVEGLKDEVEEGKVQHRNEIRALEAKGHENWLSLCQAERKAQDARKEAELLRQKLTKLMKEREVDDEDEEDDSGGDGLSSHGLLFSGVIPHEFVPPPLDLEDEEPVSPSYFVQGLGDFVPPPPLDDEEEDGRMERRRRPPPLGGTRQSPSFSDYSDEEGEEIEANNNLRSSRNAGGMRRREEGCTDGSSGSESPPIARGGWMQEGAAALRRLPTSASPNQTGANL